MGCRLRKEASIPLVWHPSFSLTLFGKTAHQTADQEMSVNHTHNYERYPCEDQIKCGGAQPRLEKFPLFSEKKPDQDIRGRIGDRPRKVEKEKISPRHCRRACQ